MPNVLFMRVLAVCVYVCDCLHKSRMFSSPCSDDDNRITLEPLPDTPDCQEDYINACYVDVSNVLNT